jgi:hypothetical protein
MKGAMLFSLLATSIGAAPALADEPPPIAIHGFVDAYYAWNDNKPASHDSFIPGTGTTAKKSNAFDLNLAAVELVRDAKPLGFHLTLVAGTGADVVHAAEPTTTFRNIYQASVLYRVSDRLLLEAGIFPSHIGFEGYFSKDNWNYTRGWLGELSPYYQTGVHATYRFNEHWTGELHVLNGWQNIGENNEAKAVGAKIAFSDERLSASLNTLDGPELPNDNRHWRHFGDLITTYKITPALSVGASIDRGRQALPGTAAANWLGLGAYSRYALDDRRALAFRVERFNDPDNGISGSAQNLTEGTLTYEFRPAANLIVKIEARRDHSTAPVFNKGKNATSNDQALLLVGAVATF